MKSSDLHDLLDEVLKIKGSEEVGSALENLLARTLSESTVLTIIANAGVHEIPQIYLRGEVYEVSRGNWDVATEKALRLELKSLLIGLASKLRSSSWQRVYLIPTGHPVLSLQIKSMVYRILRLNTIDLYYKSGTYFEIDLDARAIALEATTHA